VRSRTTCGGVYLSLASQIGKWITDRSCARTTRRRGTCDAHWPARASERAAPAVGSGSAMRAPALRALPMGPRPRPGCLPRKKGHRGSAGGKTKRHCRHTPVVFSGVDPITRGVEAELVWWREAMVTPPEGIAGSVRQWRDGAIPARLRRGPESLQLSLIRTACATVQYLALRASPRVVGALPRPRGSPAPPPTGQPRVSR